MVSGNLDRVSKGERMYTVDDVVNSRKSRTEFTDDQISDMRKKYDSEDSESIDPNDPFEKALRERMGY
jgi:bisphosphoglycerate-dependent phosphoglycerate mutase